MIIIKQYHDQNKTNFSRFGFCFSFRVYGAFWICAIHYFYWSRTNRFVNTLNITERLNRLYFCLLLPGWIMFKNPDNMKGKSDIWYVTLDKGFAVNIWRSRWWWIIVVLLLSWNVFCMCWQFHYRSFMFLSRCIRWSSKCI